MKRFLRCSIILEGFGLSLNNEKYILCPQLDLTSAKQRESSKVRPFVKKIAFATDHLFMAYPMFQLFRPTI